MQYYYKNISIALYDVTMCNSFHTDSQHLLIRNSWINPYDMALKGMLLSTVFMLYRTI